MWTSRYRLNACHGKAEHSKASPLARHNRGMQRIDTTRTWPLHDKTASRGLERLAQAGLPPHTLMQRAGLACARLARAIAPHARSVWIACGPGNNGGDGFEAALHLHHLGWQVTLTWIASARSPADAQASRESALAAGLHISDAPPEEFDLAIDALLGLGGELSPDRPDTQRMQQWLARMHASGAPVLAVDLPTGLHADRGTGGTDLAPCGPRHTLSLLSLKPGLFTAQGRDQAGQVWFDALDVNLSSVAASALLMGADLAGTLPKLQARQASHKGNFGDVLVIGGQQGEGTHMAGAAVLAARAALHQGAGRVYVALLGQSGLMLDPAQPELMFRPTSSIASLHPGQVAVVGCGGGEAVAGVLPSLLTQAAPLVLDADGLNAVAGDASLRQALAKRQADGLTTVLTPHPLEAARLLGCHASQVQADRLRAAQQLAEDLGSVVVLKGSGSVVAASGQVPVINPTGNSLLATAGTGDVLAGMVGAALAQGMEARQAALHAVFHHGLRADQWAAAHPGRLMTASDLLS